MIHDKICRFASLLVGFDSASPVRGRPPSPFATESDGGTRFPEARAAYIRRLHHFKILTAVDQGLPCVDPIGETKHLIGSVRRTLWLYLHECLPDDPAKRGEIDDLLAAHSASLLTQGIEKLILRSLRLGNPTDAEYAATVLDNKRLMAFAHGWFNRRSMRRIS